METGENGGLWQYVNPFIGTSSATIPGTISGSGNVFPGATLPFGSENLFVCQKRAHLSDDDEW